METKKFKKKIIGGFDRTEVIDYIDQLQKSQANEEKSEGAVEEIERLKKERDELAAALEKANEQLKKLSDPLLGSNSMVASSISHSKSHFDNMAALSDEIRSQTGENISKIAQDAKTVLDRASKMKADFDIAVEKLQNDIDTLSKYLDESSPFFRNGPQALEEIRKKALHESKSINDVLKQGTDLLDEATAQQTEIDDLLKKIK